MSLKRLANLDKNNLHHAYLIEGVKEEIVPEILEFIETLGVKTSGNPDFQNISVDSFKIKDARNLKSYGSEKGFTNGKKIFLISADTFLLEAQNTLLKMFEEPIENVHFFVVMPDSNSLLRTFVSRFYLIKSENSEAGQKEAENFLKLSLSSRIEFVKELLADATTESDDEDDTEEAEAKSGRASIDGARHDFAKSSARLKALKFLNSLELILHNKMVGSTFDTSCFEQIFKVREFLRMPGSSVKSLLESVALTIPKF